jgi:hypothetical protein
MIEGREYALYQGFLQRTRLVDVKLLWLDATGNLVLVLYVALMTKALIFTDLWFLFGAVVLVLPYAAVSSFMRSHSVEVVPVSVVEKERQGLTSTLFIFTRPQRSFSTDRGARLTATVHTDMADFLLGAIGPDRARGRRSLPRIPNKLRNPKVRRFAWASCPYQVSMLPLLIYLVVVLIRR